MQLAKRGRRSDSERYAALIAELEALPEKIARALEDKERLQWFASKYAGVHDAFFLGRGLDYAVALEGSLKMKEISYIHSEAYAAGELKHGTISLIENGTLVISIATQTALYEKMISNMVEVKARGGYLMGLTSFGHYSMETRRTSPSTCRAQTSISWPRWRWCPAADGLLHLRGQRSGRGQAAQPRQERHSRINASTIAHIARPRCERFFALSFGA